MLIFVGFGCFSSYKIDYIGRFWDRTIASNSGLDLMPNPDQRGSEVGLESTIATLATSVQSLTLPVMLRRRAGA
jgi:hypothetical protein